MKNSFPSVPPTEVLDITKLLLMKNNCQPCIREDILKLFKIRLSQNYFEFDNKIFTDENSLAMGIPLSPLAAEIFMCELEKKIEKLPFFQNFIFWFLKVLRNS